ncbi:hypothetical protein ACIBEA_30615 [Streptomyces sp. NPDC051555]|uniref:hypothetical protein n=1 Tax=Streptomyces sp. NPDC051555 TaxID=3365657 RepID=UPI0037A9AF68
MAEKSEKGGADGVRRRWPIAWILTTAGISISIAIGLTAIFLLRSPASAGKSDNAPTSPSAQYDKRHSTGANAAPSVPGGCPIVKAGGVPAPSGGGVPAPQTAPAAPQAQPLTAYAQPAASGWDPASVSAVIAAVSGAAIGISGQVILWKQRSRDAVRQS